MTLGMTSACGTHTVSFWAQARSAATDFDAVVLEARDLAQGAVVSEPVQFDAFPGLAVPGQAIKFTTFQSHPGEGTGAAPFTERSDRTIMYALSSDLQIVYWIFVGDDFDASCGEAVFSAGDPLPSLQLLYDTQFRWKVFDISDTA